MPAYNEGFGLEVVLERLYGSLKEVRLRNEVELIVVDDGSSDETAAILKGFSERHPSSISVYTHEHNRGLVEALKTGARAASAPIIVMLDADLSYAPDIIEPLAATLAGRRAAAVLASPYMKGGRVANVPFNRLVASRGANWLLSRCVGGRIKTFTGMVRAYDAATIRTVMERETRGEFNAWVVAELLGAGLLVLEIPAALIWPPSRSQTPSRMSWASLLGRAKLVLETACVLWAANRRRAAPRPARLL